MKKNLSILLISILMVGMFGCSTKKFDQTAMPEKGDTIATITTTMGIVKIKFFEDLAPEIVKNFTTLAQDGYYDGLVFHRVIEGFMIQGGDPKGNGTGGHSYKGEGTTLEDEIAPELSHVRGAISMANRGPDTNGSQFFIVHKDATYLDGGYSIFAQVYEGMDIVDSIAVVDVVSNDKPLTDVVIESIEITTL